MCEKVFGNILERIIESSHRLFETLTPVATSSFARPVVLGLGSTLVGLVAGIYARSNRDLEDFNAFLTLLEGETNKLEFSKDFATKLTLIATFTVTTLSVLFTILIYLIWRVRYFTGLQLAFHIRNHEQKISELQFTCERILDQEYELYEDGKTAISDHVSVLESNLDLFVEGRLASIRDSVEKFSADYRQVGTNLKAHLSDLTKRVQAFKRLIEDNHNSSDESKIQFSKMKSCLTDAERELGSTVKRLQAMVDPLVLRVKKLDEEIAEKSGMLQKEFDITRLRVYESNIMLIDSQILFDAAVSKFEIIGTKFDAMVDSDSTDDSTTDTCDDPAVRLEKCLKKAIETREKSSFTDHLSDLRSLLSMDTSDDVEIEHFSVEKKLAILVKEMQAYAQSTDLTLKHLFDKAESMDKKLNLQSSIHKKVMGELDQLNSLEERIDNKLESSKQMTSVLFSVVYSLIMTKTNYTIGEVDGAIFLPIIKTLEQLRSLFLNQEKGIVFESGVEFVELCRSLCSKNFHEFIVLIFEFTIIQSSRSDSPAPIFSKELYGECVKKNSESLIKLFDCFFDCGKPPGLSLNEWIKLRYTIYQHKDILADQINNVCKQFFNEFLKNMDEYSIVLKSLGELKQYHDEDSDPEGDTTFNLYYNSIESPIAINSVQSITTNSIESDYNCADESSLSDWRTDTGALGDSGSQKPLRLVEKYRIQSLSE